MKKFFLMVPWLAMSAVLLWLFLSRFPLDGTAKYFFILDKPHRALDILLPTQRVTSAGLQSDGWIGQRMFDEPVYSSAHAPGVYDHVDISLEVRTTEPALAIGLLRDPAKWQVELHPVLKEAEKLSDGWVRVHASFDLPFPQDELKFVLSAPGLKMHQGQVDVRAVDLRYSRPRLSVSEWWRVMKREIFLIRQRL
ncbi:hypothetical protein EXS71_04735 [Candidatus Uhrbacteria bacterium]|nr:hypothetical protein [Candidatus Uhrbacteria bacterium]